MIRSNIRPAAALLAAAALAACGGAPPATAQTSPPPAHGGHVHGPPPAVPGALPPGAHHPWTEADVRFMSAMIAHHSQAVQMARLAPTREPSPAVRTLAARIINAQQDEIALIQQWLRDRGEPVPQADADAHAGHGTAHAASDGPPMHGMLTPRQMAQLEAARGADFDRLFLTFMIQHHLGAVSMVTDLFNSYGAGQDETVFKFASDVNVDQSTEIARMQGMLADLMFEPAAAP
jgi:uncharacterized protein (DUF305 family)